MSAPEDVKAAFAEIAQKYKWDDKITKWILKEDGLAAASLNDFLHAISQPADVDKIVDAAAPDNKMLMTSRVRQAWLGLKKETEESELFNEKKGVDDPELEAMLPQDELEDMCKQHYKRYRMVWPPEVMPSDQVISQATKELVKRALGVTNVWKVKTQAMQLKAGDRKHPGW